MRKGTPITLYLEDEAIMLLDECVSQRAAVDREKGLTGYSVTNRSKLVSEIIYECLLEGEGNEMTITKISEIVRPVLKRYDVTSADLFGSFARGEQTSQSDVDLIIKGGNVDGLRFFSLQNELGEALGRKVDLQLDEGQNNRFMEKIAQDRVTVYAS